MPGRLPRHVFKPEDRSPRNGLRWSENRRRHHVQKTLGGQLLRRGAAISEGQLQSGALDGSAQSLGGA